MLEIPSLVSSSQDFNYTLPDIKSTHFALCHLASWDLQTLSIYLVLNKYLLLIASIGLHIMVWSIPRAELNISQLYHLYMKASSFSEFFYEQYLICPSKSCGLGKGFD